MNDGMWNNRPESGMNAKKASTLRTSVTIDFGDVNLSLQLAKYHNIGQITRPRRIADVEPPAFRVRRSVLWPEMIGYRVKRASYERSNPRQLIECGGWEWDRRYLRAIVESKIVTEP